MSDLMFWAMIGVVILLIQAAVIYFGVFDFTPNKGKYFDVMKCNNCGITHRYKAVKMFGKEDYSFRGYCQSCKTGELIYSRIKL